ncbi:hypothetical protein ACS0TY_013414 [Phlomoides rotata]
MIMIATKMAANPSVHGAGRGKKKSVPSSRRVWTYEEEKELVCALKELVVRGLKCDNGFKSGYLNLLENTIASKFPGTDLKGDPHINSKIHVWKKQYACLKSMLGVSGIGLNSTTYHIDALPDVWAAHIKADPAARGLKHKTFPFYNDWLEVFGNDRATGGDSQAYVDAEHEIEDESNKPKGSSVGDDHNTEIHNNYEFNTADPASFTVGESSSATKDKGKGLKRKQVDNLELRFIDTMINFNDKTDSRFGQLADTMGCIAKRVGSEFDACNRRGQVYEQLGLIGFLTVEDRVDVAQYLCNNPKDMDLFFSLPDDAKMVLVRRIMMKSNDA